MAPSVHHDLPLTAHQDQPVERLRVAAYTVPTTAPEADGTFAWNSTTIVIVRAVCCDVESLGYSYADMNADNQAAANASSNVNGGKIYQTTLGLNWYVKGVDDKLPQ